MPPSLPAFLLIFWTDGIEVRLILNFHIFGWFFSVKEEVFLDFFLLRIFRFPSKVLWVLTSCGISLFWLLYLPGIAQIFVFWFSFKLFLLIFEHWRISGSFHWVVWWCCRGLSWLINYQRFSFPFSCLNPSNFKSSWLDWRLFPCIFFKLLSCRWTDRVFGFWEGLILFRFSTWEVIKILQHHLDLRCKTHFLGSRCFFSVMWSELFFCFVQRWHFWLLGCFYLCLFFFDRFYLNSLLQEYQKLLFSSIFLESSDKMTEVVGKSLFCVYEKGKTEFWWNNLPCDSEWDD